MLVSPKNARRTLGTKDAAAIERKAAKMWALRHQVEELQAKLHQAELERDAFWSEVTGAGDLNADEKNTAARASLLEDAVWRFDISGASAHIVDGRVVVVPGRES